MEIKVLDSSHDAEVEVLSKELWDHHVKMAPEHYVGRTYGPTVRSKLLDVGAFVDGKLVGIVLCDNNHNPDVKVGFVRKVYVKPEYRKLGVATAMLDCLTEQLEEIGLQGLKLGVVAVNKDAIKFYEHYGLEVSEYMYEMRF